MKRYIIYLVIALAPVFTFTSCEVFGLDFQDPYDFDDQKGLYDNQLKEPAWDFIKSRADIFSDLIAAVEYAEIDTEIFSRPNQTLLMVTNKGLTSTTASDMSYWYMNQIPTADPLVTIMPLSWDVYPKEQVRNLILYHVLKGAYSYIELTNTTKGESMFFPTLSDLPNAYVALQMKREGALSIYFNNYPNHYKLDLKARTNNLQAPNGTYIHVMDSWLNYPSDEDMDLYPIVKN